jgi:hypothetical protein
VKVIVETTAYAKALVKLEEKSPDTNCWNDAGTFVVNINGVRTYTLSSTRRIAKIEEIAVTTVVSADDKRPVTKKEGRPLDCHSTGVVSRIAATCRVPNYPMIARCSFGGGIPEFFASICQGAARTS